MRTKLPFSVEPERLEFLRHLNKIPEITILDEAKDKYPRIWLTTLNEIALEQFLGVLDWFVQKVKDS